MKALGLDYGTIRVGVAVSYASLAQPLMILVNQGDLLERVKDLVKEHQVKLVVVGESENLMAKKTQVFVQELKKTLAVPVVVIDETLSSHQVRQYLKEHSVKRRREEIDHLAAAVILQRYLDEQSNWTRVGSEGEV